MTPSLSTLGHGRAAADARFVEMLESCTLPRERFDHRAHVRLAWLYLRDEPYDLAMRRIERTIRRYAEHLGAGDKYHQTITAGWMRLVLAGMTATPGVDDFDAFLDANGWLRDPSALGSYYSRERLHVPEARIRVVEPDLRPFGPG